MMATRKTRLTTDSPIPASGGSESTPTTPTAGKKRGRGRPLNPSMSANAESVSVKEEKLDNEEDDVVKDDIEQDNENSKDSDLKESPKSESIKEPMIVKEEQMTTRKQAAANNKIEKTDSNTKGTTPSPEKTDKKDDGKLNKSADSRIKTRLRNHVEVAQENLTVAGKRTSLPPRAAMELRRHSTGRLDTESNTEPATKKLRSGRLARGTLAKSPEVVTGRCSLKRKRLTDHKLDDEPELDAPRKSNKLDDQAEDERANSDSESSSTRSSRKEVDTNMEELNDNNSVTSDPSDMSAVDNKAKGTFKKPPGRPKKNSSPVVPLKEDEIAEILNSEATEDDEDEVTNSKTIKSTDSPSGSKSGTPVPDQSSDADVPTISEKEFCEPAFLENNLGIEEDPKLSEIVQTKEKKPPKTETTKHEVQVESTTGEKVEPKTTETENETDTKDLVNGETDDITTVESMDTEENESKVEEPLTNGDDKHVEQTEPSATDTPANNNNIEKTENGTDESATVKKENNEDARHCNGDSEASNDSTAPADNEPPEVLQEKEDHFKTTLGLVTHQEAARAKIEVDNRRREMHSAVTVPGASSDNGDVSNGSPAASTSGSQQNGKHSNGHKSHKGSDYTGTLKTVIKLTKSNLNQHYVDKKKSRGPSLKMTFQKGKKSGANGNDSGSNHSGDGTYYTIQNDSAIADGSSQHHGGHNRKSHNRSNTNDAMAVDSDGGSNNAVKETVEKSLLIPEKASSFSIHPDRLCQDQCYYCRGKFGLFDTPCHIAQIKSVERQKKILEMEEKLTADNCLCDACFRHIDKRANYPCKKRTSNGGMPGNNVPGQTRNLDGGLLNESGTDQLVSQPIESSQTKYTGPCQIVNCAAQASHFVRRKWMNRMRKSINKVYQLELVNGTNNMVPICEKHYNDISYFMVCVLCKRRLLKNHIYNINQNLPELEQKLIEQGIPVTLGPSPVVCRLCRHFATLCLKPPDGRSQKASFAKDYRRRLLRFHNCQPADESEAEDDDQSPKKNTTQKQKRSNQSSKDVSLNYSSTSDGRVPSAAIMLDDDVMVDYDIPILDAIPNYQTTISYAKTNTNRRRQPLSDDLSNALRSNPNISMRELFPGEEEMGLNVSIPFANGNQRNQEGWTKIQTTLQYDEPTRRLWDYLQMPYGNQSSFLRHLILLEKYFRNGDLVLSQNASNSATTYAESVQNRLKSFDSIAPPSGISSAFNKLDGAPISIFPKPSQKTKQILSENNVSVSRISTSNTTTNARKPTPGKMSILKVNNTEQSTSGNNNNSNGSPGNKNASLIASLNKPFKSGEITILPNKPTKKSSGVPPELISINKQSGSTNPTAVSKKSSTTTSPQSNAVESGAQGSASTSQVIKLPDTLSEEEYIKLKDWRPTLIPTSSARTLEASTVRYLTADGVERSNYVEVQYGGKPYFMPIHDYNKFCLIMKERSKEYRMQRTSPPMSINGSARNANISDGGKQFKKPDDVTNKSISTTIITGNTKVQIPNKILEQNSVIPVLPTGSRSSSQQNNTSIEKDSQTRRQMKMPAMKPVNLVSNHERKINMSQKNNNSSGPIVTSVSSLGGGNAFTSNYNSSSDQPSTGMSALDILLTQNSGNWGWSDTNNVSVHKSMLLDNSAASILSKIPSSLTVIPQQKGRASSSSRSSADDQTNA